MPSEWTVDTAMAHLQRQLDDLRVALDARYATQIKTVETAFLAQQTAMQTAFQAADKAVVTALQAAEKAVDVKQTASDREFHEHLEQVRHENQLAFINSDKAIAAALTSQKEAVAKAEASVDKRLEGMNEFRKQLGDQAATFISRKEDDARQAEAHARIGSLTERIALDASRFADRIAEVENRLTSRLDLMAGQQDGGAAAAAARRAQTSQMIAIVSVVLVAVSVAVAIILGFN